MSVSTTSIDSLSDDFDRLSKASKDDTLTVSTVTSVSGESDRLTEATLNEDYHLDRLISERNSKLTTATHEETDHSDPEHQSKFKILFNLLKKLIGVKDIVSLRIPFPIQLIEPIGNLEYWNYNDRPDYFLCIGDPDDPLERMLAAIRWWYSKDLKFVKSKLIKPYNSILGEQFSCYWEVTLPKFDENNNIIAEGQTIGSSNEKKYRVTCLNEQISHHPPVSAFYYQSPEKGITARGIDHIAGKFTGTSVKLGPGDQNKGIYINLENRDNEEYLMTHPTAAIQGWLKGSLYIVVSDVCIVTCQKTKLKAILEYKEERWLGKPKFAIEGKIFRYDPENDEIKKFKNIKDNDVVAEISGSWRGEVYAKFADAEEKRLLLDMEPINPIRKVVKPLAEQGPLESRKIWQTVTAALIKKDYSLATKEKQTIEERQRQKAAELKSKKEEHNPVYFYLPVIDGRPELKIAALDVLKTELNRNS
ncbi:hypothetical protein G9A89_012158 [Geosiphon pyriformis]|nr:hypothetical protein G9A89_012158 [Geosiphon pyriformis]